MSVEYAVLAILLVCNCVLTTEWARYGLWEMGLQRPLNPRAVGASMVGMLTLLAAGLLQKQFHLEFHYLNNQHLWVTSAILFGPPIVWMYFFRHVVLAAGLYDYNRAILRTTFWTARHYRPGVRMGSDAQVLENFPAAQQALRMFKRSIDAQEKGTTTSTRTKIIDLDEVNVSYRGTARIGCPNCGMSGEVPVDPGSGGMGGCPFCGKMMTVKSMGGKLYINSFGGSFRMVTNKHRQNIATAYEEMGLLLRMMNRFDEADDAFEKSLSIVEELLGESSSNQAYLALQSLSCFRRAEALHARGGETQQARALYQQSLAIDRRLGNDSDVPLIQGLLAQLS